MSWQEHKRRASQPGAYTYKIVDYVLIFVAFAFVTGFVSLLYVMSPV